MEYAEDEYLMISGIQHFKFCRRQWALIHVEQQWAENVHTVTGELMHKKAHDPYLTEKRKDTIIVRALPVSSRELGISGECDVVEFQKCEDGIQLHGHRGLYSVFPVEYKKGKPKLTEEDQSFRWWHRRYVWRKCFRPEWRREQFSMAKQEDGSR